MAKCDLAKFKQLAVTFCLIKIVRPRQWERLPRLLEPTHLVLLRASSYSSGYSILSQYFKLILALPRVWLHGENPLPRIHQAASVVFRSIGGFGHCRLNPHLTGRSLAACKHLHRMWFPHPERMGCTKNLLNLGLEWVQHNGVNLLTIFEDSNPFEIIFDYRQGWTLSRMMTWCFFNVRRDWKFESIQTRIEQNKFGWRPTMTGI